MVEATTNCAYLNNHLVLHIFTDRSIQQVTHKQLVSGRESRELEHLPTYLVPGGVYRGYPDIAATFVQIALGEVY